MKKLFVVIIISILFLIFFTYKYIDKNLVIPEIPDLSSIKDIVKNASSSAIMPTFKILTIYNDQKSAYEYFIVNKSDTINLIPNFDNKISSEKIKANNLCKLLANGGYYTPESKPLGLFIADGKTIQKFHSSKLLDGLIISDGYNSDFQILFSSADINSNLKWAVQTGPILVWNSKPTILKIIDDQPARRLVVAINDKKQLIFIIFFDQNATYGGPMLSDLPDFMIKFAETENQKLKSAINLDGGSASAFITDQVNLPEFSMLGSAFCIK